MTRRKTSDPVFRYRYFRSVKHGWKSLKSAEELPDNAIAYETLSGETGMTTSWQKLVKVPIVHHGAFTTRGWKWVCGYRDGIPLTAEPPKI